MAADPARLGDPRRRDFCSRCRQFDGTAKTLEIRVKRRKVGGRSLPEPMIDDRVDIEAPYPDKADDAHEREGEGGFTLFWAFSHVKYWTAKHNGPREPGQRPEDLQALALRLIDILDGTWRAGYKSEHLLLACRDEMRRRKVP